MKEYNCLNCGKITNEKDMMRIPAKLCMYRTCSGEYIFKYSAYCLDCMPYIMLTMKSIDDLYTIESCKRNLFCYPDVTPEFKNYLLDHFEKGV
jgi:hypothetical protein